MKTVFERVENMFGKGYQKRLFDTSIFSFSQNVCKAFSQNSHVKLDLCDKS